MTDRTLMAPLALALAALAGGAGGPAGAETVPVNGLEMHYVVTGEGPALVLLHGAYGSARDMEALAGPLSAGRTVYALDLQGHGGTTDIDRPMAYATFADDVAAFMDAVGVEAADVVGYSMGAGTAIQVAIRHPSRVTRLVSISGSFDAEGLQPAMREMAAGMTPEMFVGTELEAAWREQAPDPEAFRPFVERMIALEHEPQAWGEDVARLAMPVLLIQGDLDIATPEHAVAFLRALGGGGMGDLGEPLPRVRLAILPATSHTAVMTQPELLLAFIGPFLADEAPRGMFDGPAPGSEAVQ